jgi:hypothetical protein
MATIDPTFTEPNLPGRVSELFNEIRDRLNEPGAFTVNQAETFISVLANILDECVEDCSRIQENEEGSIVSEVVQLSSRMAELYTADWATKVVQELSHEEPEIVEIVARHGDLEFEVEERGGQYFYRPETILMQDEMEIPSQEEEETEESFDERQRVTEAIRDLDSRLIKLEEKLEELIQTPNRSREAGGNVGVMEAYCNDRND